MVRQYVNHIQHKVRINFGAGAEAAVRDEITVVEAGMYSSVSVTVFISYSQHCGICM